MPIVRVLLTWLLFLPVPIVNGILREKWYRQAVGDLAAHWIGTIIVSTVYFVYAYVSLKSLAPYLNYRQLFLIGFVWLALTLAFEFGIGLAGGRSWQYMLADYNISKGRIWPLVLLIVFFSPFLVKRLVS